MKIGFIGLGNMAGAICQGIIESGFILGKDVYGYDLDDDKLQVFKDNYHINTCCDEIDVVNNCDYLLIGVKPIVVEKVLSKIKDYLNNQVIISIVAGYGNDKYEALLPNTHHLTIMPNTPAKVKAGLTLFEQDNTLTSQELEYVTLMFESIGEVCVIKNEQMSAASAISGCGPAFVYMFIEALADGGVLNGLPRDIAYKLASQMVLGSAKMVKDTNLHPGVLKDQVCSPGGITIKGVKALEENNFRNAVIEAVDKAK